MRVRCIWLCAALAVTIQYSYVHNILVTERPRPTVLGKTPKVLQGFRLSIMDSITTNPPASFLPPPLSLLTRLSYALQLWVFKFFVATALGLFRIFKRSEVEAVKPTYTRRYKVLPMLENRVFIPKDWKAGTKIPLYIDIHGGGFALCDPQTGTHYGSFTQFNELIFNLR